MTRKTSLRWAAAARALHVSASAHAGIHATHSTLTCPMLSHKAWYHRRRVARSADGLTQASMHAACHLTGGVAAQGLHHAAYHGHGECTRLLLPLCREQLEV